MLTVPSTLGMLAGGLHVCSHACVFVRVCVRMPVHMVMHVCTLQVNVIMLNIVSSSYAAHMHFTQAPHHTQGRQAHRHTHTHKHTHTQTHTHEATLTQAPSYPKEVASQAHNHTHRQTKRYVRNTEHTPAEQTSSVSTTEAMMGLWQQPCVLSCLMART